MTIPPSIERARAYLDAHLARPFNQPNIQSGPPEGPFITMSRESGSGGSGLAQMLADRFNAGNAAMGATSPAWTVFDQNLVDEVLRAQHLSPQLARFLPEDKVSEVESSVREIVGLHPNLWMLVQQTNLLIRGLAIHGHAIIVGRGSNLATSAVQHGLHIRLVGPSGYRAENLARRLKMPVGEAAAHNRHIDAARRDYVRSVFNADVANPDAYDLVINVARNSASAIVDMLAPMVAARSAAADQVRVVSSVGRR